MSEKTLYRIIISFFLVIGFVVASSFFLPQTVPSFLQLNRKKAENFAGFKVTRLSGSVLSEEGGALEKMALMESFYRLKPDSRFLAAIPEIDRIVNPEAEPAPPPVVSFADDAWHVMYRDREIGTLPEVPDMGHYMEFLTSTAKALLEQAPPRLFRDEDLSPDSSAYAYDDVMRELNACGARWDTGADSPACVAFAAHGYTAILMQAMDDLDAYDTLAATPAAWLAVAKARTGEAFAKEEARLAVATGYRGHAERTAAALPENDPLRLYIEGKGEELEKLAVKNGPEEALLLGLQYISLQGAENKLYTYIVSRGLLARGYWLPVVRAILQGGTALKGEAGKGVQEIVLSALSAPADGLADRTSEFLSGMARAVPGLSLALKIDEMDKAFAFEKKIEDLGEQYKTQMLAPSYVAAFYGGYFYSGIYREALWQLDTRGDMDAARLVLLKFRFSASEFHTDFVRLFENLIDADEKNAAPDDFFGNLVELRQVGKAPLLKAFNANIPQIQFGAPEKRNAVKVIFRLLDTRPDYLAAAGGIAFRDIYDMGLAEKLLVAAKALGGDGDVWSVKTLALLYRDPGMLFPLLDRPRLSAWDKSAVLSALGGEIMGLPPESTDELYGLLSAQHPEDYDLLAAYADILEEREGAEQQIAATVQAWLAANPKVEFFPRMYAMSRLARAYNALGLHLEARRMLEPALEGWHGAILTEYANTLAHLGMDEDADKMFSITAERYPTSKHTAIDYGVFLWRQGRYAEAAGRLRPYLFTLEEFNEELPKKFADTFRSAPDAGKLAFAEMMKGVPRALLSSASAFIIKVARAGRAPELALGLTSLLPQDREGFLFLGLDMYEVAKLAWGEQKALDWLKGYIPPQMLNQSSVAVFEAGEYQLLWDLIENPDGQYGEEYVWMLRAAAFALVGGTEEQGGALHAYFTRDRIPGKPKYAAYARYILGMITREEMLPHMAGDNRALCEGAFFIAVKAMSDRDFVEANRWLQLSMETASLRDRELAWANQQVFAWWSDFEALSQKKFFISDERMERSGKFYEASQR